MMWLFEGTEYVNDKGDFGFVYEIENILNGKKYIGKKLLLSAGYKTVKGKRKKIKKESDWQSYWGSSPNLTADIELHGKENFKRTILRLCSSKAECSYYEAKLQFDNDVLLDPKYYNGIINCRINHNHLKHLHFKKENL